MSRKIKVLFADDHPIFRQGLRQVLESDSRLAIVGEVADGASALAQIKLLKPDIALLDIDLPQINGLDLVPMLQKLNPPVDVVVLTMCKEENIFNAALDRGVKGYILKDNAVSDVIDGIISVAAGNVYLSPSISGYLLRRSKRSAALVESKPGLASLSPMERRVLKSLGANKTSKEIGEELFISHRTVETHCANIRAKLELHGAHKLLQFAIEHKSDL
jgi:DNA-binding NarL/FixJ family response regulator